MRPEETDAKAENGASHSARKFAFIAALLAGIVLLALFVRIRGSVPQPLHDISISENTHADYQRILGETHPGIRLARLADFLKYTPDSADANSARLQHDILQMHEQRAWADLSETIYALEASVEDKTRAKDTYIENWSTLTRIKQLDALPLTPPTHRVKAVSIYTEPLDTTSLAGEPEKKRKRKARASKKKVEKPVETLVVKARIKRARAPVYPRRAQERQVEALIVLNLTIDKRGRVIRTRTLDVDADRYKSDFIRAAKRAARRTRFHPKTINGKPVGTRNFKRKYKFSMQD